jgi:hypothetical protein
MANSNKIYRLMLNKDYVDSFPERRLRIYMRFFKILL